jgi:Asp-tRNA(Asn)/Glu-tRNA(Gln) amidotransferase A subunit family amidase
MVPLALGTQHTASTLLPASFCGAFGFKPTSGFTSMHGSNILVPRLVNIGFLARSVEDLALFVAVFSGAAEASLTSYKAPRLGWVRGPAWSKVAADADAAFAAFRSELPMSINEVELPSEFDNAEGITHTLLAAHMAHRFASLSETALEGYCAPLRDLVLAGRKLDARSYIASDIAANHLAESADRLFADVDALITLSAPGEATQASDPGSGAMCMPWSLAGLPAVSVPLLRGANRLPIGVQLIAPRGQDARLLSIAGWLTNAIPANRAEA